MYISKRLRKLEEEWDACNEEAKKKRNKLKPKASFDADYWIARRDIAQKQLEATLLTIRISIASMKDRMRDNTKNFVEGELGLKLILEERSLELDSKLYQAQAERMGCKELKFNFRRSFMRLFVEAQTGLGIKNTRGQRDNSLQSAFRSELKIKMDSQHPDPIGRDFWCPVTSMYWSEDSTVAGHLFPWNSVEANTSDQIHCCRRKRCHYEFFNWKFSPAQPRFHPELVHWASMSVR